MDEYYRMANVVLRMTHSGDGMFRCVDDELGRYRSGPAEAHCTIRLERDREGAVLPDKAVRSAFFDGQTVYSAGGDILILNEGSGYLIKIGKRGDSVEVRYSRESDMARKMTRWILKWLVIRAAEGQGLVFLHASAAHFRGKNVVFCGDSHCGKSSALLRLVRSGASVISDDSVMTDGESMFPFTFKTTVDEDFAKRFGVENSLYDIGMHSGERKEYGKVDYLIFVRIWNSGTSQLRPLDYPRALLALMRIYKKEIPSLWAELDPDRRPADDIFRKYSTLLEDAKTFEFYAGSDEDEVRRTLLSVFAKA